jgi:hypothetical protein
MEHLIPPSENIKGCECIFADTVFYENGEAKVIIKMDKDYCLTYTKNPVKLISRNISKEFYQTVRERKRHYLGVFQMKYGANILNDPDKVLDATPKRQGSLIKLNEAGPNRMTGKDFIG